MAKRFTDPKKWDDPWFMDLPLMFKLLWIYCLDKCDHAGIWKVNRRLADWNIGAPVEWDKVGEAFGSRFVMRGDYWFIPKFMVFQYGNDLNYGKAVLSAVKLIEDKGFSDIAEKFIGNPYLTVRQQLEGGYLTPKATAIAKSKSFKKERDARGRKHFFPPEPQQVREYAQTIGYEIDAGRFCDYYSSKGWTIGKHPMKDWRAAVRTWKRNDDEKGLENAPHDGASVSEYAAIARANREAAELRKKESHERKVSPGL